MTEELPAKKGNGRHFTSDDPRRNKGGKPKWVGEMAEYASQHTKEAIDKLVHLMKTGKPEVQLKAAIYLVDRALGKPVQALAHSGSITTHEDALKALANELESAGDEGQEGTCH